MTVRELKDELRTAPDDADVVLADDADAVVRREYVTVNGRRILRAIVITDNPEA